MIECVIIAEREVLGSPESKHLSGGYAKMKLFPVNKDNKTIDIDLLQGTPRALLSSQYKDEWKGARCQIKFMKYSKLDALIPLVP